MTYGVCVLANARKMGDLTGFTFQYNLLRPFTLLHFLFLSFAVGHPVTHEVDGSLMEQSIFTAYFLSLQIKNLRKKQNRDINVSPRTISNLFLRFSNRNGITDNEVHEVM